MTVEIHQGDCLEVLRGLPSSSVNCCVTSPPYWGLRDYGVDGQLGLERTPDEYVARMVAVFAEVKRVLRDDGTLWLNIGDSYAGSGKGPSNSISRPHHCMSNVEAAPNGWISIPDGVKAKDLVGIPWMLAFALRADGWYLRSDIIWSKPNPMPESVTDRPTKAHEYIFLLSKNERYYYDAESIKEKAITAGESRGGGIKYSSEAADSALGGSHNLDKYGVTPESRNKRTVWEVATQPTPDAHFATFPEELIKPCILAGCPAGGTVLDPFFGSGTTGLVARANGCNVIGIELNPAYIAIARRKLRQEVLDFSQIPLDEKAE